MCAGHWIAGSAAASRRPVARRVTRATGASSPSSPMQHVAGNTGAPVGTPAAVEGYLVTSVDNVDQSLDIP